MKCTYLWVVLVMTFFAASCGEEKPSQAQKYISEWEAGRDDPPEVFFTWDVANGRWVAQEVTPQMDYFLQESHLEVLEFGYVVDTLPFVRRSFFDGVVPNNWDSICMGCQPGRESWLYYMRSSLFPPPPPDGVLVNKAMATADYLDSLWRLQTQHEDWLQDSLEQAIQERIGTLREARADLREPSEITKNYLEVDSLSRLDICDLASQIFLMENPQWKYQTDSIQHRFDKFRMATKDWGFIMRFIYPQRE